LIIYKICGLKISQLKNFINRDIFKIIKEDNMTPIEIIAIITATLILVKCFVWVLKPQWGMKLIEKFLKNPLVPFVIYFILVLIVGYYVIQDMNIVQIAAVLLLSVYIIKMIMSLYSRDFISPIKKIYEKQNWQKWFAILILLLLACIIIMFGVYT
jgi:hypothetical protein